MRRYEKQYDKNMRSHKAKPHRTAQEMRSEHVTDKLGWSVADVNPLALNSCSHFTIESKPEKNNSTAVDEFSS